MRVVGNILKIAKAGIGVFCIGSISCAVLPVLITVAAVAGGLILVLRGFMTLLLERVYLKTEKKKEKKKKEEDKFAKINALLEKNLDTIASAQRNKYFKKRNRRSICC